MSEAQQSLGVGASTEIVPVSPTSDRHGSGHKPDSRPGKSETAPGRDVRFETNMYTSLLPSSSLQLGMRIVRAEHCYRCGRETSHGLKLIELKPRTWEQQCNGCSQER